MSEAELQGQHKIQSLIYLWCRVAAWAGKLAAIL